jgi:hypothetical protein
VTPAQYAAVVSSTLLLLLALFQLLLAAGVPWGRAAWRGAHRVLPKKLRWASFAAIPVLLLAAWAILARSNLIEPGSGFLSIRILTWVFSGYFCLNTIGNIISKSSLERWIMTPLAAVLSYCFLVAALS